MPGASKALGDWRRCLSVVDGMCKKSFVGTGLSASLLRRAQGSGLQLVGHGASGDPATAHRTQQSVARQVAPDSLARNTARGTTGGHVAGEPASPRACVRRLRVVPYCHAAGAGVARASDHDRRCAAGTGLLPSVFCHHAVHAGVFHRATEPPPRGDLLGFLAVGWLTEQLGAPLAAVARVPGSGRRHQDKGLAIRSLRSMSNRTPTAPAVNPA